MQRMTGIDPMFVYSETPETPMEVAYACVFDPTTAPTGYSFEAVRARLAERVPELVPFRRRLLDVPFGLDHPRWVDDPEFDLDNHLSRVAVPSPGDEMEFSRVVAHIMSRPLAPDQPPWEMHVAEGLADGKVGLIAKMHHSVIDGVAAAQLLAQLLDISPDGREVSAEDAAWRPPELPSKVQMVADVVRSVWESPFRTVRAAHEVGRTTFRLLSRAIDPNSAPLSLPLGAPSTFEEPVGADRAVAFARLDLGKIGTLKAGFGVTCNDVVMAVCSGALRAHLSEHGGATESPLVAVVPVSVRRRQSEAGGNRLSAMFVPLANHVEFPLDRLRTVVSNIAATKSQERAVGYGPVVSALSDAMPPAVVRPVMRLGAGLGIVRRLRPGNLTISNVPGPTFPLYFAGMQLEKVHPLGPVVDGIGLNVTVQTYVDSLFVGINSCAATVPDVAGLAHAMVRELDQLISAAAALERVNTMRKKAAAHPTARRTRATRSPAALAPTATSPAATSPTATESVRRPLKVS
jgi:diacylglycerol O-acyltransferase